jgi:N-acyl-D-aspartate/D-glutamate deacylase
MPSMITSENENCIRITSHPEAILSHPSSVVHAKLYQSLLNHRRLFCFMMKILESYSQAHKRRGYLDE